MRSEPMIAVRDVPASAAWYCRLLDCTADHGRSDFDRLVQDGEMLLMLHTWGGGEHGGMKDPGDGAVGNGFVLWLRVNDVDAIHARAVELGAEILTPPWDNPQAGWRECSLRDPDGYVIAVAQG